MQNIPIQYDLSPELPNIYGTLDYQTYKNTLNKINEILIKSGLENRLVDQSLNQMAANSEDKGEFYNSKSAVFHWKNFRYALRCNIAKQLILQLAHTLWLLVHRAHRHNNNKFLYF